MTGSRALRGGWLAALSALLLFIGLALFGARYHWVEEAGSAERDAYVDQARQILDGSLPRDPFRPLLYPLLTAGLSHLVGDPFVAARLLSNLAAAALAWLAYAFGRRLAGPACGGWAMALVAVNPNLWTLGQHVSTDMLFAALAAAVLLAGFRYLEEPRASTAVLAGALLGLAGFTRSNAPFLFPALLAAGWLAPGAPGNHRRRLAHLAGAVLAFLLVLAPHWALRYAVFGDPFHDENWKNVAWKLHGYPDWSYLDRVPYSSLREIVLDDPMAVVRGGLVELGRFASSGAAQLLGTWAHVLLFAGGSVYALRRRPRAAGWLLFSGAGFLVATSFAFFAWGRLLLLLLPMAAALGFSPWDGSGGRRSRALAATLSAALILLLAVKTFAFRLPAFVERHPYREVAALQRLDASLPPGAALAGSSPFLGRYLEHHYLDLPDAFGPERTDPHLYFGKVERLLAGSGAAYLVIGEVDLRDRPASLLSSSPPVPWLALEAHEAGVTVWRVAPSLANRPLERTVLLPAPPN